MAPEAWARGWEVVGGGARREITREHVWGWETADQTQEGAPHRRQPGDRLARLDLLARRRLAEEAPGRTAPKLRGAHARNSAQGVLM